MQHSSSNENGLIICGGGYKYLPNAWIATRLFRLFNTETQVQWWVLPSEYCRKVEKLAQMCDAELVVLDVPIDTRSNFKADGQRAEWLIKPFAILGSRFKNVVLLDADNFPVYDPLLLLNSQEFNKYGSVFWPDLTRMTPDRSIWRIMDLEYRDEPEFESGQMLISNERCGEALEFALWMNKNADFFYKHIWGDKDTFRFAWHKYGLPYAMIPHPVQILEVPGGTPGIGVMCQHDFEGARLFQHRNMAKWDLLGSNPRIPGFLYEHESREFLGELRRHWNGRVGWNPPSRKGIAPNEWRERMQIVNDLTQGCWLFEDRRPRTSICCGPLLPWSKDRTSKPWAVDPQSTIRDMQTGHSTGDQSYSDAAADVVQVPAKVQPENSGDPLLSEAPDLRNLEFTFTKDGTLDKGATLDFYFWDIYKSKGTWMLSLSGTRGTTVQMRLHANACWHGQWVSRERGKQNRLSAKLFRVETEYPATAPLSSAKPTLSEKSLNKTASTTCNPKHSRIKREAHRSLVLANHAFGIGDAVMGFYAAVLTAQHTLRPVVYHTRHPKWIARVNNPLVTATSTPPKTGTPDMDIDYAEQLRYAPDKVAWYRQSASSKIKPKNATHNLRCHNSIEYRVDQTIQVLRLEFPKYVILSPFAAWQSRDWPQAHWRRLAWLLDQAGYVPVAVGTGADADRMAETFNKSNAYWALDHTPEWVTDAMLGADAVIGLDSGMVHVAGLLRLPTVCLHSHLPTEFLFTNAPTLLSVHPRTSCTFCRWQIDRGFNEGCGYRCSALATVGPEEVMEAFLKTVDNKAAQQRRLNALQ
jgi:hypothetical protein